MINDEFEQIIEYTESDEEGLNQKSFDLCDEIQEVSEESLKQSLIEMQKEKIGPYDFEPISLLGQGSFGEVYLVRMKSNQ